MRTIMVLNSKGGCGKSTLATCLAGYYAHTWDAKFGLVDYDPQGSSLDWLKRRGAHLPPILGYDGYRQGLANVDPEIDTLIIDPPARCHGEKLANMVRLAETIVVPVLPSPIDIHSCGKFVQELFDIHQVQQKEVKVAVVANRVREHLLIWSELERFLRGLKIPFLSHLRDSQNYIRAYTRGMGVHELPPYLATPDWEQWTPVVRWLGSKRSRALNPVSPHLQVKFDGPLR